MDRREGLKIVSGMALTGAAVGAGALVPQIAQAQNAQSLKIGIVDEAKIGQGYVRLNSTMKKYEDLSTTLNPQLDARLFMTQDEGTAFDQLILKDNRSPADQTRLVGLVKQGATRQTEYNALIPKGTRNDDENKRMKELQAMAENARVGAARIQDQLLDKIKTQQKGEVDKLVDAADGIISQVAEQQGLTLVMRKDAVVWSKPAVDITEAVLKQLNK